MKASPKKTENLRVRIETELAARVARAAAADDRSVGSFVRLALLERLERVEGLERFKNLQEISRVDFDEREVMRQVLEKSREGEISGPRGGGMTSGSVPDLLKRGG